MLVSFLSFSFAASELDSCIFLDIFDIDKSDLVDGLEYTISRQT